MASEKHGTSLSNLFFQLLGATAGLVVLMTLLGALASWQRLKTLGLPNNAALATLSQTTLLVAGINALALPIGIGLLTVAMTILMYRVARRFVHVVPWWCIGGYAALILIAATVVGVLRLSDPWYEYAAYVAAAGLLVLAALAPLTVPAVAFAVFFAVVLVGATISAVQIVEPPTHLERATLYLRGDRHPQRFFWIASSSDTVYVAPQVGGRSGTGPCQVAGYIVGFPRSEIARIELEKSVEVFPPDPEKQKPPPDPC
jgi:hypothetical protein